MPDLKQHRARIFRERSPRLTSQPLCSRKARRAPAPASPSAKRRWTSRPILRDPRRRDRQSLRGHGARLVERPRAGFRSRAFSSRPTNCLAERRTRPGLSRDRRRASRARRRQPRPRRARFSICSPHCDANTACLFPALRRRLGPGGIAAPSQRHALRPAGTLPPCWCTCGAPIDEINAVRKHRLGSQGRTPGRRGARSHETDPRSQRCARGARIRARLRPHAARPNDSRRRLPRDRAIRACCPNCRAAFRANFRPPGANPGNAQARRPCVCERAISCCCSASSDLFHQRATSGRRARLHRRLRQLHRRLAHRAKPPIICSGSSIGCATPIPAAASP